MLVVVGIIAYKYFFKKQAETVDSSLKKTTIDDLLKKGYDMTEANQILESENVLQSGNY